MRPWPVAAAAAIAGALVVAYVALGGTSYRPTPVADPCEARPERSADGTAEQLEAVLLAAADGAACTMGVSREELVLALRSVDDLEELAAEKDVSRDDLERALRDGLERAVAEAEEESLIGGTTASVLRFAASRAPLGLLLTLLRGASSLVE